MQVMRETMKMWMRGEGYVHTVRLMMVVLGGAETAAMARFPGRATSMTSPQMTKRTKGAPTPPLQQVPLVLLLQLPWEMLLIAAVVVAAVAVLVTVLVVVMVVVMVVVVVHVRAQLGTRA